METESLVNGASVEIDEEDWVTSSGGCGENSPITNSGAVDSQYLAALERQLQKRLQIDVIRSFDFPPQPPPKPYASNQKEVAAKLYELCNEYHYLELRLKHIKQKHNDAMRCLEKKWVSSVVFEEDKDQASDDVSCELKFWSLQMKLYEEKFKRAVESSEDFANSQAWAGQLCFDSSWSQEAFQETLEFTTDSRDYRLKIIIRYDGEEINVDCSVYMEGLRKLVETCFNEKCSVDDLIHRIWELFESTVAAD